MKKILKKKKKHHRDTSPSSRETSTRVATSKTLAVELRGLGDNNRQSATLAQMTTASSHGPVPIAGT